jgi:hypothetical protein
MLSSAPLAERSHSGLVRRFAKPLKGVSSSEGSNPSLSATPVAHVPVAQWIERQVADLKVGGSSPLGHAIPTASCREPWPGMWQPSRVNSSASAFARSTMVIRRSEQ